MKLKSATLLLALAGMVSAQAAQPFSDVTPQDWAYQAVQQLAAEGIIEGYPDRTFRGEKAITRYEMAQLVARAMVREDRMNAEQQQQLQQLEAEFANELSSLGVRVSALEDRVDNVKISGAVRLSYQTGDSDIRDGYGSGDDRVEAKADIKFAASVSPKTTVTTVLESTLNLNGEPYTDVGYDGFKDHNNYENLEVKYLFAQHHFDKGSLVFGKYRADLGVTGIFYNDAFSGVGLTLGDPTRGSHVKVSYGNVQSLNMPFVHPMLAAYDIQSREDHSAFTPESLFLEYAYHQQRKVDFTAWHLLPSSKTGEVVKVYGAGLSVWPHPFVNIHGDYILNNAKNMVNNEKPKLWTAGASFGIAHPAYPRSFQVGIDYFSSDAGSYFGGNKLEVLRPYLSGMQQADAHFLQNNSWKPTGNPIYDGAQAQVKQQLEAIYGNQSTASYFADMMEEWTFDPKNAPRYFRQNYNQKHGGAEGWMASLKYVPVKNVYMEAFYVFNAKNKAGAKLDDTFRIQATYLF